jgi:hypothetical protein
MLAPCEADCGSLGSAEPSALGEGHVDIAALELIGVELPGVIEDGMSDTMGQAARCGTIGALETSDKDLTHA